MQLSKGQNTALPGTTWRIRVEAARPAAVVALPTDAEGRLGHPDAVLHSARPQAPGLSLPVAPAGPQPADVLLDAGELPAGVERVYLALLAPAGGGFAGSAPRVTVSDAAQGTELAVFTMADPDPGAALVAVEVYLRQGAWKVRAIGQGYAGGAAALLADHGLPAPSAAGDPRAQAVAALLGQLEAALAATGGAAVPPAVAPGGPSAGGPSAGGPSAGGPSASGPSAGAPSTGVGVDARSAAPAAPHPAGSGVSYAHPGRPGAGAVPPVPPVPPGVPPRPATAPAAAPTGPAGPQPAPAPASASGPAAGAARGATGWSDEERYYNQVWGVFEDTARSSAAYRSAAEFADNRLERELEAALADPRARAAGQAGQAEAEARARHGELMDRARADLDRDTVALRGELDELEAALPPALARWDSPAWLAWQPPEEMARAVRFGDVRLRDRADLPVPMLTRLPLERGLWIDTGGPVEPLTDAPAAGAGADVPPWLAQGPVGPGAPGVGPAGPGAGTGGGEDPRAAADRLSWAVLARLLAAHPAGALKLHVVDPAGPRAQVWQGLVEQGILLGSPARTEAEVTALLEGLTQHADLMGMALRGGALDALPPHFDPARRLLVVHDFPHGFDDRTVGVLRYLAEDGPSIGVHLMLVADRSDSREYGHALDALWRSVLRLSPQPDEYLMDPWVGHPWVFTPEVPADGRAVGEVFSTVGAAMRR
ncbi:TerD family protein [Allostreptomyces psammosilenae]|nr:TerD family protein [Allostreptomyces psammosilenae]